MFPSRTWIQAALAAGLLLLSGPGPERAFAAGIDVALLPATAAVEPLESFELELTIPLAGDSFNAYQTTITYDPAVLTFEELVPVSLQEGALMTAACANRWHDFGETAGVIELGHALLCAGTSVTGPGITYRLRFTAPATAQVTHVSIQDIVFGDAGVGVYPVRIEDARVEVGNVVGLPGDPIPATAMLGAPVPNPFHIRAVFPLRVPATDPVRLEVFDLQGRLVRRLSTGAAEAAWDGRDERGALVPASVYLVRLRTADTAVTRRVVRLR